MQYWAHHHSTQPPTNKAKITNITNPPDPPQIPRNTQKKGSKDEKMTSKTWSKNDANSSKNGPGGARMHQKWSQNREKCAESPKVATRWLPRPLYSEGSQFPRRFLAIFGYPLGAQKSTKIDIFPKKPSQGARFHRFLLRMSFSSIFRLIFSRFWMKNQ